jgi:hypothetical protein
VNANTISTRHRDPQRLRRAQLGILGSHDLQDLVAEHGSEDHQAHEQLDQGSDAGPVGRRQRPVEREQQHDGDQDADRGARHNLPLLATVERLE